LSGNYSNYSFALTSDGSSGTDIQLAQLALFTSGADIVDFNNLAPEQQLAIAGGADIYHGLGGSDVVTLPDEANYNESVGNGQTLDWTDTPASTFYTGSRVGDTYTVNGGDGDYYISRRCGNRIHLDQW
jgi:hypothetical protein